MNPFWLNKQNRQHSNLSNKSYKLESTEWSYFLLHNKEGVLNKKGFKLSSRRSKNEIKKMSEDFQLPEEIVQEAVNE